MSARGAPSHMPPSASTLRSTTAMAEVHLASAGRDALEIFRRLFDHGSFTRAEAAFLVRELETRGQDRDVAQMFRTLELTTEMADNDLDRFRSAVDTHVVPLNSKLDIVTQLCAKISASANALYPAEREKRQGAARERREAEWEAFVQDMCLKKAKVDAEYDAEEQALRRHYTDLEDKLKKTTAGPGDEIGVSRTGAPSE